MLRCAPRSSDHQAHDIADAGEPTEARQRAVARGVLTHRLLQSLPDIRREDRAKSMQDFLARQSGLDRGGVLRTR